MEKLDSIELFLRSLTPIDIEQETQIGTLLRYIEDIRLRLLRYQPKAPDLAADFIFTKAAQIVSNIKAFEEADKMHKKLTDG